MKYKLPPPIWNSSAPLCCATSHPGSRRRAANRIFHLSTSLTLALATDYDCWKQDVHEVAIADVLAVLQANVVLAKRVIHDVVPSLAADPGCGCGRALEHAIITDRDRIPARVKRDLAPIIGRYVGEDA